MRVDDVSFDDVDVVVFPERCVHLTRINFLGRLQQQPVFVERHLDDSDVVGLRKSGHEVAQSRVESSTAARGDHVGGKRSGDDLFDQNALRVGHLERVEGVFLKVSSNGVAHLV